MKGHSSMHIYRIVRKYVGADVLLEVQLPLQHIAGDLLITASYPTRDKIHTVTARLPDTMPEEEVGSWCLTQIVSPLARKVFGIKEETNG